MTTHLFNEDCMTAMSRMNDNTFDLAIVDPVYDLPTNFLCPGNDMSSVKGRKNQVKRSFIKEASKLSKQAIVTDAYFKELQRVSREQIIWGINYFPTATKATGRIVWDKQNDSSTFSNCEIASCSLIKGVRIFRYLWNGMIQKNMKNKDIRIHPFQKPVDLYKWILIKYAKYGDRILDTHLGSGSSAIAAYDLGFDFTGYENDVEYFNNAVARLENHQKQQKFI